MAEQLDGPYGRSHGDQSLLSYTEEKNGENQKNQHW